MNLEIKQRIKQIKKGQVPQDYKKTKIGIIPNEWEVKCLGEVGENFDYGMNAPAKEYDNKNKYIRITDIDEDTRKYLYNDIVSPNAKLEEYFLVKDNDILFARTGASTGKTYLYNKKDGIIYFAGFLIRVNIKNGNNAYYIFQNTMTVNYKVWIQIVSMRSGQPGINAQELKTYLLPVPPLAEQQKIAEILSTQDKVIEFKGKLIQEKQKQKKYLMQNLLTGKMRLKGFIGEWKRIELGEIFDYVQPTPYIVKTATYNDNYKTPVLTAGKSFILGYTNENFGIYVDVPTVIFDDFTTSSQFVNFPFKVKSSAIKILKCKKNYDIVFCFAMLQSVRYVVGGHERHWISKFSNIVVKIPKIEEQKAIAKILSTQDKEIKLLQKELEEEKQKKKALMQLLLTGIVRV